jgi:hypothetical protein
MKFYCFMGAFFVAAAILCFFGWRANGYKSNDDIRRECHARGGVRVDGRCVKATILE